MKDRRTHLKIKIKTLTAEAAIIRFEAAKTKGDEKWILNDHRTGIVRDAARRNLLAYAMLRGKSYAKMEQKTNNPVLKFQFTQIVGIAERFGCRDKEMMQKWMLDAVDHLKSQGYVVQCPNILPKPKPDTAVRKPILTRVSEALGINKSVA